MEINKRLGYYIPRGKKVRMFTLGCGNNLVESLMCEGASSWLHSVHILYAKEATEDFCSKNNSKFVSEERLRDVCNTQERIDGVIDIFITATLSYKGQRKGRVNRFFYLIVDGEMENYSFVDLDNTLSRDEQESIITKTIIKEFCNQTEVIFAGSFNPMHLGHVEICNKARMLGYKRGYLQISDIHPTKGILSSEEVDKRIGELCDNAAFLMVSGCGSWVPSVTSQPLYIDKYNEWSSSKKFKQYLLFIIGLDVWETYHKEFEKEFKDIDNVSFLVFNRYSNEPPREELTKSEILHKASFQIEMENLTASSTKIRQENE